MHINHEIVDTTLLSIITVVCLIDISLEFYDHRTLLRKIFKRKTKRRTKPKLKIVEGQREVL